MPKRNLFVPEEVLEAGGIPNEKDDFWAGAVILPPNIPCGSLAGIKRKC